MRVVVVVPWEPWRLGDGVVLPLYHHLHVLSQRHELVVLAGSGPDARERRVVGPEHTLPPGQVVRWFGSSLPSGPDYAVRRLRSELRREPAHALFVERKNLLDAFAEETRIAQVVYLVGWGTAQLAARTELPAVHFAVDPWGESWRNRRLPPLRRVTDAGQRSLVLRHEARHYPRCASVALVAESDVELLRRQVPGGRYAVVPNGVAEGPEPAPGPRGPVLGFHGAFETQANVDGARALVEEIWPRVAREVPEATVLLVGRHPSPEVQSLVRPGVTLKADVPSIRGELDQMAVEVAWMTSGLGLKNKVLEAMAAGLPVVANTRGASGIGAGAGVFGTDDPATAAQHLIRLLQDESLRRAEGQAARTRVVEEFSWTRSAELMESLWEQAVR